MWRLEIVAPSQFQVCLVSLQFPLILWPPKERALRATRPEIQDGSELTPWWMVICYLIISVTDL